MKKRADQSRIWPARARDYGPIAKLENQTESVGHRRIGAARAFNGSGSPNVTAGHSRKANDAFGCRATGGSSSYDEGRERSDWRKRAVVGAVLEGEGDLFGVGQVRRRRNREADLERRLILSRRGQIN